MILLFNVALSLHERKANREFSSVTRCNNTQIQYGKLFLERYGYFFTTRTAQLLYDGCLE
jgi:hypothetical protein